MDYPWLQSANKIFRIVLLVQWLISIIIAFFTASWLEPFLLGIPILALPLILSFTHSTHPISRYAFAIGVQLFTALHLQQSYGFTELHFEIFVVLAFLSYFRDWKIIAVSTLVVAIHHIAFYIAQLNDIPVFIFEEGRLSFGVLVIHALFAVSEGIILGFMAKQMMDRGVEAVALSQAVHQIMQKDGYLDLKVDIPNITPTTDKFIALVNAFKALIKQANELSDKATTASEKMTQSSLSLDSSVTVSTEKISSISSSIPEISNSIHQVAELSTQSNEITETAQQNTLVTKQTISDSGTNILRLKDNLNNASATIQSLSTKCNNISDVMQSIKSVAEQTNLLALNAAIESARAGEHGRGFAVVADEVRSLAIKSKESAEEIQTITTELINSAESSVNQMNDCVNLVDNASESSQAALSKIDNLVNDFLTVSNNINSVASSTSEQATNVSNISESSRQLYELSNKELENVKRVKQEALELAALCKELDKQLNHFSV